MKTIEQLLALKDNPYYQLSPDEQAALDAFLFEKQAQKSQAQNNGNDSEKNIPATVINKNVVQKEVGEIPVMENIVHPDAVN